MKITVELTEYETDAMLTILSLIDWEAQSEQYSGISSRKRAGMERAGRKLTSALIAAKRKTNRGDKHSSPTKMGHDSPKQSVAELERGNP
jgi:hypothetical protein